MDAVAFGNLKILTKYTKYFLEIHFDFIILLSFFTLGKISKKYLQYLKKFCKLKKLFDLRKFHLEFEKSRHKDGKCVRQDDELLNSTRCPAVNWAAAGRE